MCFQVINDLPRITKHPFSAHISQVPSDSYIFLKEETRVPLLQQKKDINDKAKNKIWLRETISQSNKIKRVFNPLAEARRREILESNCMIQGQNSSTFHNLGKGFPVREGFVNDNLKEKRTLPPVSTEEKSPLTLNVASVVDVAESLSPGRQAKEKTHLHKSKCPLTKMGNCKTREDLIIEEMERENFTPALGTSKVIEVRLPRPLTINKKHGEAKTYQELQNEEVNEDLDNSDASELWRPASSMSEYTLETPSYGRKILSHGEWLQLKMSKRKLDEQPVNAEISVSEALGKECQYVREAAFQRWLKSKKKASFGMHTRKRPPKMQKSSSENGITFEMWIELKRKSYENVKNCDIDSKNSKKRENIKYGMTFDEWKKWKDEQMITIEASKQKKESITDDGSIKKMNGNTFEKWLQKKNELKKAEDALRATIEAQSEAKARWLEQSKLNDPRQRTFEEWLMEKTFSEKFKKSYSKGDEKNNEKRFPEDSTFIFDMWLKGKLKEEFVAEENKLKGIQKSKRKITQSATLDTMLELSDSEDEYSKYLSD